MDEIKSELNRKLDYQLDLPLLQKVWVLLDGTFGRQLVEELDDEFECLVYIQIKRELKDG